MNVWLKNLEALVGVNSFTKNKQGVDAVGNILATKLTNLGFSLVRYSRDLIGDHLLFQTPHIEGEKILLLGHLDTVFEPNTFETFSMDSQWVYGPGVCDMKGGLIVALSALEALYKTKGAIVNIDFLCVSDEETGSDDSKMLTSSIASNYDYCFVFEAAGKAEELVVGRKGIGTFYATITGKASHSGVAYEKGIDANLEAARKLEKLVQLTDLSVGTTVNVGKINGGIGANTISPQASLVFEVRFKTVQEKERILREIEKITQHSFVEGTTCHLEGGLQRDVMEPCKAQYELVKFFENLTFQKIPTQSRGGVSDANTASSAGVLTLDGFGPFGDGDHTPLERALITSFESRIALCVAIFEYQQTHLKLNTKGML